MRIALISDTHLTSPDPSSNSLWPRKLNAMGAAGTELYHELRKACQIAYDQAVEHYAHTGPYDLVVHLGDMTGGYNERGFHHPTVRPLAEKCRSDLMRVGRIMKFCPGNHDLGYRSTLPGSGINPDSIRVCQEVFGELFWYVEDAHHTYLGVCSSLCEYSGQESPILNLKREQEKFIAQVLAKDMNKPWVIIAHNPKTTLHLAHLLKPHMARFHRFVFGDLHVPSAGKAYQAFGSLPFSQLAKGTSWGTWMHCLVNSVMCPSTAPLWWKGHGIAAMDVTAAHTEYSMELLTPDPRVEKLPTSSAVRCLWWMVC